MSEQKSPPPGGDKYAGFVVWTCRMQAEMGNAEFDAYILAAPEDPPPQSYVLGAVFSRTSVTRRRGGRRVFNHPFVTDPRVSRHGLVAGVADRLSMLSNKAAEWLPVMAVGEWKVVEDPAESILNLLVEAGYIGGAR